MPKEKEKLIRTACYCRVSTKAEELLNSLENQAQYYTRYIKNHPDLKMAGLYIDKGISGKSKDNRPGFLRMLRHCEQGRIDLIITKSVSRFARNTKDFLEVVNTLQEKGVDIYFQNENIHTSTPNSSFLLSTLAAVAQEEIRSMSQNEKWAKEKRVAQGKPYFKRILGYNVERENNEFKITINEEEAEIVREIFALAYERVPLTQIARQMMEKGYKTVNGSKLWDYSKVKSVVTNIRYTGDVLTYSLVKTDFLSNQRKKNTGERNQYLIENHHPAIISQEMFEEVQNRIVKQRSKEPEKRAPDPLSGRVFCGLCGARNYRTSDKKKPSWLCKQIKMNPGICEAIPIREKEIEEIMQKAIQQRYDFSNQSGLLKMKWDLKRTNDIYFEYHRLSLIYRLKAAKEKERCAPDDAACQQERLKLEQEILEKEVFWQQVEEDREYRNQALELIDENDINFTIQFMRAFILKIELYPSFDFKLTWFDGTQTNIKETKYSAKGRKLKNKEEGKIITPNIVEKIPVKNKEHPPKFKEPPESQVSVNKITKDIEKSPVLVEKAPPGPTKKRVCGYARVSTDEEDQLSSFQFQIVHYTYLIHKNPEWLFCGIYADEAASATSTKNRTNFNKMIADACAGKIDMIITKSISRFSRNTVDCIKYVRMLKSLPQPVEIRFEKENINTFDDKSELLLTIFSSLAQEESRNISENVKWGRQKLVQRGMMKISGHRFYGYDSDKNGNWIINVEQAEVVRRMYDEYLKGKSTAAIAKDLTERGVLSPTGLKAWNRETVDSILKSEKNIGNIITQKTYIKDYLSQKKARNNGELPQYLIENHHPPIIEPQVYEAVQKERERRREGKVNTAKKHMNQTAFSKIFYCAQCGGLMIHTVNNVKKADGNRKVYHYWRCCAAVGYDFSRECKAKGYREEILEHTFMAMLQGMKENPQLQKEVNQAIQDVGLSEKEKKRREELREKSKEHYRELYQRVEANRDREDFDIQNPEIKNITDKIIDIEKELESYSERMEKVSQMQEELDWLLKKFEELEGTTFRDDIFRRIVKRGEVHADGRIVYHLTLGIKWTAHGNDKKLPKAKDSNR